MSGKSFRITGTQDMFTPFPHRTDQCSNRDHATSLISYLAARLGLIGSLFESLTNPSPLDLGGVISTDPPVP